MKKYFLLVLAVSFILFSCDDDSGSSDGALEIVFKAEYDGSPLVMNGTQDFGDKQIKINTSSYFLSDVQMVKSDLVLSLADIMKVDHSQNTDLASAITGEILRFEPVPAGNYTNFRFGVGVSPTLNQTAPSGYGPGHPLSLVSDYWDAWNSYIFSKLEGKLDTAGLGTFDLTFIYHSGKDELYQNVSIPTNIVVEGGKTTRLEFVVDHYDLLHRNDVPLDIEAKPTAHSAGDLVYPTYILENFGAATNISLQ